MKLLLTQLLLSAFCFTVFSAEAQAKEFTFGDLISQSFELQGGIANNNGDLAQVNPLVFGRYGFQLSANLNEYTALFAEGGLNGGYTQFRWIDSGPLNPHFFFSPDLRIGLKFNQGIFAPFVFLRLGTLTNGGWESDSGIGTTIQIVDNFSLVSQLSVNSLALTAGIRAGF